jgi:two-component system, OmpR family, sensor kinase
LTTKAQKIERKKEGEIFNISYLVLAVLIFLTLGVTYNFYKSAQNKDTLRFGNQVNRLTVSIDNRIKLYTAMLKGGRGFIETSKDLNRERFAVYVSSLNITNRYPGIQGIGYAQYFPASEQEDVLKRMKSEGYTDFRIFPEGRRDFYTSIVFLEPLNERNRVALGYDMYSDPVRREAMKQARDTGEVSASGKVALIQANNEEDPAGFLLYLPIYKNGQMPDLIEDKEKNLRGFIYIPFRAKIFINEIYQSTPENDVRIQVYDGQITDENLLAETEANNQPKSAGLMNESFTATQDIDVGGRKWVLRYTTLPNFTEQSSVSWTPLILLCGISFSFLLFGMTYREAASRAKAQKIAAELFELQKERERLFENEKKAREIAEQANVTKDEFIAIVSHELKTPLNAIAGWTRILKTGDISDQTKNLALNKIDKNLRTQAGLVEQLLTYSDIISGRVNIDEKEFNLDKLFEEVCGDCEILTREKKIEFTKENFLNESYIRGEREKIKLALSNLFSNALKFTQSGGKLEASAKVFDDFAEIKIKDSGRGISSEFLPHIFEHYKQSETPNTRNYGGLGLGLAITKHIIELHKGKVFAESEGKDRGSIFTVRIPISNGNSVETY